MKLYKIARSLVVFLLFLVNPLTAKAWSMVNDDGISVEDLSHSLSKRTKLSSEQIKELIELVQKQMGTNPDQKIPIKGYLYASGLNGGFFVDHDVWAFDANILVPGSYEVAHLPKMYLCDFHNGGLKFEIAYKWMFTFIPSGVNVDELNGAVYGRGVGLVGEALLGLEGSWMPAQNRAHDLFHVAIKLGVGAGIVFPKMEFKLREIK